MGTANKKPIRIRLAEKLIQNQQELEPLAVQVSLGKVEIKDELILDIKMSRIVLK